jgi:hypothetical protein
MCLTCFKCMLLIKHKMMLFRKVASARPVGWMTAGGALHKMPLRPQVTLQVFKKWAIYFVGPINPLAKRSGARYSITMTEYLTRCA